jgi:hypothetical protein
MKFVMFSISNNTFAHTRYKQRGAVSFFPTVAYELSNHQSNHMPCGWSRPLDTVMKITSTNRKLSPSVAKLCGLWASFVTFSLEGFILPHSTDSNADTQTEYSYKRHVRYRILTITDRQGKSSKNRI